MNHLQTRIAVRFRLKPASLTPGHQPAAIPIVGLPHESAAPEANVGSDVSHGLQLTRASTIALTRLQLALAGGELRQAMAAIDRLHALDGEFEHLLERLPPSAAGAEAGQGAANDPATLLRKHLADQKLALAFEKLAFASGIAGPDLISPGYLPISSLPQAQDEPDMRVSTGIVPPIPSQSQVQVPLTCSSRVHPELVEELGKGAAHPPELDPPPLVDWHAFPEVRTTVLDRIPTQVWAFLLALVMIVLASAAVVLAMV